MSYEEIYQYGFTLGLRDGQVAARWLRKGRVVDHGDLLSATDAYAVGYRKGLGDALSLCADASETLSAQDFREQDKGGKKNRR